MELNERQILSLYASLSKYNSLGAYVWNSVIVLLHFALPYVYVLFLVSAKVGEWNESDRFIPVQAGSLIVI